jgi:adenine deaminase
MKLVRFLSRKNKKNWFAVWLNVVVMFGFLVTAAQSYAGENNADMRAFLEQMPKAELHLHLEGSLDPQTVSRLANNNDLNFFNSADDVKKSLSNREPGLNGFLSHYNKALQVLKTQDDFYNATYELLRILDQNNIIYVDLFFDPQEHTRRGISFDEFFNGIDKGRIEGEKAFGIKVNLIMCINRNLSVQSAIEALEQAENYKDKIIGFGMDSGPEYGNPPLKFKDVFARARREGYYLTGHHDVHVQDSVKHIWQSLDIIKLDRIDHGLDAVNDAELVTALRERNICLTGSPVKRTSDPEPQDIDAIRKLDDNGVCVSLHSDDPGQFESGYLSNMMILVQEAGEFSKADMTRLMLNAFRALWLSDEEKKSYINKLKTYAAANTVVWNEVTRTKSK